MVEAIPHDQVQTVALAALVLPTLRGWATPGPELISRNGWLLALELESGVDGQEWAQEVFCLRGALSREVDSIAVAGPGSMRPGAPELLARGQALSPWPVMHRPMWDEGVVTSNEAIADARLARLN